MMKVYTVHEVLESTQKKLAEVTAERDALKEQNAALAAELAALSAFRDEVVGVMNQSQGVWGWHKNHQIATWDELFPVVPDFESPQQHLAELKAEAVESVIIDAYDAVQLNDFGGGNVGWWQDYIRSELAAAHDFYQSQLQEYADSIRQEK